MYHLWTQNVLHVAANRSTRCTGVIDKKLRSRYIERLTDFGSFLALLINSTLHKFFIVHAACMDTDRALSRGLAPSGTPRRRIACGRETRARTRGELITTAPQTRNYTSTARHKPRYHITKCTRTKSRFHIARKNDWPRETSPDPLTSLGGARSF